MIASYIIKKIHIKGEEIMRCKFWTVQNKSVLNTIIEKGKYYPDFNKSEYLKAFNKATTDKSEITMEDLYGYFLESFRNVNNVDIHGLVFAFCGITREHTIGSIGNFDEFEQIINNSRDSIKSLWSHYNAEEHCILELDFDKEFLNPLFIHINDFQYLMPPVFENLPPYTSDSYGELLRAISQGKMHTIFPTGLVQAHLPYIDKSNLVNAYEFFELN